jgi:hypothetical protein
MKRTSEYLSILIATAEDLIRRPQLPSSLPATFAHLASEIRRIDAQPAEDVRVTAAALVMIIAIEKFYEGPHEKTSPWLMLAGATLPLLRTEAWLALNAERGAAR